MRIKTTLATAALIASLMGTAASAETLRYAFQGTLNQLDPYSLNETFTLGTLGNVYEGLTRRRRPHHRTGSRRALGGSRTDPLALLSAQGRQVPQRQ